MGGGEPTLREFGLTPEDIDLIRAAKARSDALAFRVAVAVFAFAVIAMARHVHEASGELGLSVLAGFLAGGALGLFANIPLVVVWDAAWSATHKNVARLSRRYRNYLAAREAFALEEARRYEEFLDEVTRLPDGARRPAIVRSAASAPSSGRGR